MYSTEASAPRKDAPTSYRELLNRMEPLCNRSRTRNHHEMFSIGYLFAKFKMSRFEDIEFLYNAFSVLPTVVSDGLINL